MGWVGLGWVGLGRRSNSNPSYSPSSNWEQVLAGNEFQLGSQFERESELEGQGAGQDKIRGRKPERGPETNASVEARFGVQGETNTRIETPSWKSEANSRGSRNKKAVRPRTASVRIITRHADDQPGALRPT